METAAVGLLAEQAISTTAEAGALVALSAPTLPLKAIITRFATAGAQTEAFYRKHHTLTIAFGRAYILGGLVTSADHDATFSARPVDGDFGATATTKNLCAMDVHVITLGQFLHSKDTPEYQVIPVLPATEGGHVPGPRHSHTTVVDGDDLVLFGGIDANDNRIPAEEVWRFNTNTLSWRRVTNPSLAQGIASRAGLDLSGTDAQHLSTVVGDYEYKVQHAADGLSSTISWRNPNSTSTEPGEGNLWLDKELPKNPLTPGPRAREQTTNDGTSGTSTTTPESTATLLPISTGQGRNYLAFLFTITAPDIWALQIHSSPSSITSIKDKMRDWMEWDSGFLSWARVEVKGGDFGTEDGMGVVEGKVLPGRMEGYAVAGVDFGSAEGRGGRSALLVGGVDAVGRGVGEMWRVRFE